MGIESDFNFIDSLDALNPAGGDNLTDGQVHLRGIKNAVKGSFPSLGAAAVTSTAADLNSIASAGSVREANYVTRFNGRPGLVVPADDDYSLGQMSDVDLTTDPVANLDMLRYDGSNFVPVNGPTVGYGRYNGLAGFVDDQIYFTNEIINSFAFDGLGTIDNTGVSTGFQFTANRTCLVQLNFQITYEGVSPEVRADWQINGTTVYAGSSTSAGRSDIRDSSSGNCAFVGLSGSQALGNGDYFNLYLRDVAGTPIICNLSFWVMPISTGP